MIIQSRSLIEVNTDPQKRCYNGCHKSSEMVWTNWSDLDYIKPENEHSKLTFWRELNAYAVKSRGEGAKQEFRCVP